MKLSIIGRSAIEFWLGPASVVFSDYSCTDKNHLYNLPKCDFSFTAADCRYVAERMWLTLPLETFSFNHNHHQNGKVCHVLTRYMPFPEKSFVRVKLGDDIILVARPELCFIQAAKYMEFPDLVHLGIQLCSMYYLKPAVKAEMKASDGKALIQEKRAKITNVEMIRKYIDTAKAEYGVKTARKAVRYIVDDSNSPMESKIAALMSLPVEYGGFGMPKFTMNEPMQLSETAKKMIGCSELRGDFMWKEKNLVAEYNSTEHHSKLNEMSNDANRVNAMQQSGYKVMQITYANVNRPDNLEKMMQSLMQMLGREDLLLRLQEKIEERKALCMRIINPSSELYHFVKKKKRQRVPGREKKLPTSNLRASRLKKEPAK